MTKYVSGKVLSKYLYIILCVILLLLTAGQLYSSVLTDPHSGWDYRVYLGGVQSINHGENPYDLPNVTQYSKESNPFTYPPHTLFFLWCIQVFFIFQSIWVYYAILVALLIVSGCIILTMDQKPQYLFFVTLLLTGFTSTFWNFLTGNKDILFLFLFAWIFYLLMREKLWQSSIVMGLMGSFSLITIPFIAIYLVVKRSVTERIQYILLSIGVVAVIFLITWLVSPSLLMSYIETLSGKTSPIYDKSGWYTLTPFLMFGVLVNRSVGGTTTPMILVSSVYICLILSASWFVIRKNQENQLILYSFVMLAIFMVLPRIKAYDFIILTLPLYFLFKDFGNNVKVLVLVVVSLLPLSVWYYFLIDHTQPISYLTYLIHEYSLTFSLLLIFIIAFTLAYYQPICLSDDQT